MPVMVRYDGMGHPLVSCTTVEQIAIRMLQEIGYSDSELSILLCDDSIIRELNFRYRKLDKTTDVLSFSMLQGEPIAGSSSLLGDIVISLSKAKKQAEFHKISILQETKILLAHGLLHLIGFDHKTDAEEKKMRAMEARLIAVVR